ncbi:MAG: vWA domain-containing protein [Candidatus Thiodiazotropha sp.]
MVATAIISGSTLAADIQQQSKTDTNSSGYVATETPRIQLAILLDTSNSMDGLIDQTRNQLWQIVNQFSTARKNGVTPILEIALFEYGNDGLTRKSGFVRMLNDFTRELDQVSEGLFSLTTNGGSEFCGYAINTAINNLQWSRSKSDIKSIFIAGNESFAQGPIDFHEVAKLAVQQGISINTIHAGGYEKGISDSWQTGALLASGSYMSINSDQKIVHIEAPQDKRIAELNAQLNTTYLPYGKDGAKSSQRQLEQDSQSSRISAGLLAKRAKSKSSSFYSNASWDLVDALREGKVDEKELSEIEEQQLPDSMKGLSSAEKLEHIRKKEKERSEIKKEIEIQSELRAAFVAKVKRERVAASPTMSDALTKAIKKQAEQKKYIFEK